MVWTRRMLRNRVTLFSAEPEACHVAILAGVHGNERAGFFAFERLFEALQRGPLLRGKLSLIPGNVQAAQKKRPSRTAAGQDMNRLFDTPERALAQGLTPEGPDWERAQQLLPILREVDVLLDLHSTSTPSEPFAIVRSLDSKRLDLLRGMPVSRVDYGYDRVLPGCTMQVVDNRGGLAITVECGEHRQGLGDGGRLAYRCAVALLHNLGMLKTTTPSTQSPTRALELVYRGLVAHPPSLEYAPGFHSGAPVAWGQLVARDETRDYVAPTKLETEQILGHEITCDGPLQALMVTPRQRVAQVLPHDAFLLGMPHELTGPTA